MNDSLKILFFLMIFAVLLPGLAWCDESLAAQPASTPVPDQNEKKAEKLIEKVSDLGDKVDVDYIEKKKLELLKKYPTFEKDYLTFVRGKYPTLESEMVEVFRKFSEPFDKNAKIDADGKPVVSFEFIEQMCMTSGECSDELGDLFKKKYPDFAKESARYVLDKKPEILVELVVITLEVMVAEGKIPSSTRSVQSE